MIRFRFFTLDATGRIERGIERDCRDEADAIAFAEKISDAHSVEVWRDRTLVTKVYRPRG